MTEVSRLLLQLDGFEGPLDLLLELSRAQKVDLARISILDLVEQFVAVVEGAAAVRLELAADWLVMAAWLAWLKSRLLLPSGAEAVEEGEGAAEALAERLATLAAMRQAAGWLAARPQLGHDVFARGGVEDFREVDRSRLSADVPGLLRAYMAAIGRAAGGRKLRIEPHTFWTVQDALDRLSRLVGGLPSDGSIWASLERFMPELERSTATQHRAALASTLLAGLELARNGDIVMRQETAFGPIMLRPA